MTTEETTITKTNSQGEITYYKAKKIVKKIGTSGHVVIPVKLLGKEITILYGVEDIK